MIAGTTDTNFTDSKATGELAQDSADNANEAVKHKSSLYKSTSEPPLDDLTPYSDGDQWYVVDENGTVIRMYQLTDGAWVLYKWDQESLSVKTLSALSADLGNVTAGNLTSVNLTAATINSTDGSFSICEDEDKSGSLRILSSGKVIPAMGAGQEVDYTETYQLDKDGIHEYYTQSSVAGETLKYDMSSWLKNGSLILRKGSSVPKSDPYTSPEDFYINYNGAQLPTTQVVGDVTASGRLGADNISIGKHVINSIDGGTLYFEDGVSAGNNYVNLHSGPIYINGSAGSSMLLGGDDSNVLFQRDNSDWYFRGNTAHDQVSIHAKSLISTSKLSTKQDITKLDPKHANEVLLGADIQQWRYINTADQVNKQTGVVIDDINKNGEKKYGLPSELIRENGEEPIDVGSLVGYLIAQNQYQAKQIEELNLRVAKLEVESNAK